MIDESTSVSTKIDQYFEWSKTKIPKKNLAQNKLDEEDSRFIAIASTGKRVYASVKLRVTEVSALTPGPIVEENTTDLT